VTRLSCAIVPLDRRVSPTVARDLSEPLRLLWVHQALELGLRGEAPRNFAERGRGNSGSTPGIATHVRKPQGMTTDDATARSAWSELLDYLSPDELPEILGVRGQMMLEREIEKRPSVLMNEENLDAVIVDILVEVHGSDPMVLVR